MILTEKQKETLSYALNRYGFDKQCDVAIEEMAELTKAIIKYRRYGEFHEYSNICEEVADVIIMAEQIVMSVGEEVVAEYIDRKIKRLYDKMGDERGREEIILCDNSC